MARKAPNPRPAAADAARATAKLWQTLRGSDKDKPVYVVADQLVQLLEAAAHNFNDLDTNWAIVQSWQSGAEPDGTPESPEMVVLEFRNQFLRDSKEIAAALEQALKCAELTTQAGFEECFSATTSLVAAASAILASIKKGA